jgi:hypothetical protein
MRGRGDRGGHRRDPSGGGLLSRRGQDILGPLRRERDRHLHPPVTGRSAQRDRSCSAVHRRADSSRRDPVSDQSVTKAVTVTRFRDRRCESTVLNSQEQPLNPKDFAPTMFCAARVAELADARDLGSRGETLEGSSPSSRTTRAEASHRTARRAASRLWRASVKSGLARSAASKWGIASAVRPPAMRRSPRFWCASA